MTPVRGHHDQVASLRRSGIDDCLVHVFVLDVQRLAGNPGSVGRSRNDGERFLGVLLRMLLVLTPRVFDLARGAGVDTDALIGARGHTVRSHA
jgi:hypothetical protein